MTERLPCYASLPLPGYTHAGRPISILACSRYCWQIVYQGTDEAITHAFWSEARLRAWLKRESTCDFCLDVSDDELDEHGGCKCCGRRVPA